MTPAIVSQPVTVELAGDPLVKQVADLRVRLAEAETTIDAIHEFSLGYVDLDEGPVRGVLAGINGTAKRYLFGSRRRVGR